MPLDSTEEMVKSTQMSTGAGFDQPSVSWVKKAGNLRKKKETSFSAWIDSEFLRGFHRTKKQQLTPQTPLVPAETRFPSTRALAMPRKEDRAARTRFEYPSRWRPHSGSWCWDCWRCRVSPSPRNQTTSPRAPVRVPSPSSSQSSETQMAHCRCRKEWAPRRTFQRNIPFPPFVGRSTNFRVTRVHCWKPHKLVYSYDLATAFSIKNKPAG